MVPLGTFFLETRFMSFYFPRPVSKTCTRSFSPPSTQRPMLVNISVFLRHKTRPLLACLASKQFFVSIVRDDAGMVHTRNKRQKNPHGQFPKFHFPRSGICIKQLNSRRHTPSFSRAIARPEERVYRKRQICFFGFFGRFLDSSQTLYIICRCCFDVGPTRVFPRCFFFRRPLICMERKIASLSLSA